MVSLTKHIRITGERGRYSFDTLPPDTYVVRVVPQPGLTLTTPDPVVIVSSGDDAVNIGQAPDTPVLQGYLIGIKFNDLNFDGLLDLGEPGLPNITIYLYLNNNNVLDSTEAASISDSAGNFSFNEA